MRKHIFLSLLLLAAHILYAQHDPLCLSFDARWQHVAVGVIQDTTQTGPFTIAARFKSLIDLSDNFGYARIACWNQGAINRTEIGINNKGNLELFLYDAVAKVSKEVPTTFFVNDGQWHSFVFVQRAGHWDFFADGSLLKADADQMPKGTDFYLGGTGYIAKFTGAIDDVMVFTAAATGQQVQAMYGGTIPKDLEPHTLAYYACDQGKRMADNSAITHLLDARGRFPLLLRNMLRNGLIGNFVGEDHYFERPSHYMKENRSIEAAVKQDEEDFPTIMKSELPPPPTQADVEKAKSQGITVIFDDGAPPPPVQVNEYSEVVPAEGTYRIPKQVVQDLLINVPVTTDGAQTLSKLREWTHSFMHRSHWVKQPNKGKFQTTPTTLVDTFTIDAEMYYAYHLDAKRCWVAIETDSLSDRSLVFKRATIRYAVPSFTDMMGIVSTMKNTLATHSDLTENPKAFQFSAPLLDAAGKIRYTITVQNAGIQDTKYWVEVRCVADTGSGGGR